MFEYWEHTCISNKAYRSISVLPSTSKLVKFVGQYNILLSMSLKLVTFCWGWTL